MSQVGVEALAGFTSAFVNVRLVTPASSAFAFAATIGAGTTAQLGAMKINEEVDALAVMGIRPIAYLASTRLLAGMIVVIPLYCVALLMSFFSVRVITTAFTGKGPEYSTTTSTPFSVRRLCSSPSPSRSPKCW